MQLGNTFLRNSFLNITQNWLLI